jgi:hypothetical protein
MLALAAVTASGQVLERPARTRRTDADARPWYTLVFTSSTLGGYDENLTPEGSQPVELSQLRSGYTGFADAALRYQRGRQSTLFDVGGRAYVNSFRNIGLGPSYGGDVQVRFGTAVGIRHQLDLSGGAGSAPFYALGSYGALRQSSGVGVLPDAHPANGMTVRRSTGGNGAIAFSSQWSRRDSVALTYRYDRRDFDDHVGDSKSHLGSLAYRRNLGRRSGVRATYSYSDAATLDPALASMQHSPLVPARAQSLEASYEHERNFSPTRRLYFSFGAGAAYVETLNRVTRDALEYVAPSGSGTVRLDWARTWSVAADYRRSVSVLEGLTAESFVTNAAVLRVGGFVQTRSEVVFSVGYSDGRGYGVKGGTFEAYSANSQFRYLLGSQWSAVVSHNFSTYRLHGIRLIQPGFPAQFDRNAVRVGLSFALPLAESRSVRQSERSPRSAQE